MSYPVTRHAHVSGSDQQEQKTAWQPRKQQESHMSGFEEKFNELFGGKEGRGGLPMYKDKPFTYASSKRRSPWWKRRGLILSLLGIGALSLYWMGFLSGFSNVKRGVNRLKSETNMWERRRERVRDAFKVSWKAYEKHAWGYDKYHPVSKTKEQMVPNGMGWIVVDALDTMILMNLTKELTHAREWVYKDLSYDQDHDVNTFETTIRMLGGLLSAHYLSTAFPLMAPIEDIAATGGEDLYIEKATDLAQRLLGAYESASGIPYASINLKSTEGIVSHDNQGASSTAEAASLQLEMKYLASLTGEESYWTAAEKVIKVIDDNGVRDGLVPIYIHAEQGTFQGNNIRLGSRGDSYYEYLIKQYLQTSNEEPIYLELWEQALAGVQKHLITYSEKANLTILAERPNGLGEALFPKMDHLVCFMPGSIALAATEGRPLSEASKSASWGPKQEGEMKLAKQLMKTCWGMYAVTATGLAPEIAHFHVATPPPMMAQGIRPSPDTLSSDPSADWRQDFDIHNADLHNLQRPETVESLFYMWRITGDPMYREWGWTMFEAFNKHTFVSEDAGFSSVGNVNTIPPPTRDNMESFWLAETLKYFYLLFGPDDVLPLDQIVLNTEAHPFPRFKMGTQFRTGWTRKPRDKDGNILGTTTPPAQAPPPAEGQQLTQAQPIVEGQQLTQARTMAPPPGAGSEKPNDEEKKAEKAPEPPQALVGQIQIPPVLAV